MGMGTFLFFFFSMHAPFLFWQLEVGIEVDVLASSLWAYGTVLSPVSISLGPPGL